jgi:hypothetical protein
VVLGIVLLLGAVAASPPCSAAEQDAQLPGATSGQAHRPTLEITTSSMPRLDIVDGATRDSRLNMTLLPRRSGFGFSLGMTSAVAPTYGSLSPVMSASPLVDLGVHWRYTLDDNYRFDVTAYRRVSNTDAISLIQNRDPSYGARVEMRMGTVTSKGFVADRGFVGFQLESGARITVKRSRGGPMFYYRNTF